MISKPLRESRAVVTLGINAPTPPGHPRPLYKNFSHGIDRIRSALKDFDSKVTLVAWESDYPSGCPRHEETEYAFKPFCLDEARRRGFATVLWLDSSISIRSNIDAIFKRIEERGYLFVRNQHSVGEYCKDAALAALGLTREDSFAIPSCASGILGLSLADATSRFFLAEWLRYAKDGQTFRGAKWSGIRGFPATVSSDPRVHGHRHDQAVASVLAWGLEMREWVSLADLEDYFAVDRAAVRMFDEHG